jgi:hypothetical protein
MGGVFLGSVDENTRHWNCGIKTPKRFWAMVESGSAQRVIAPGSSGQR